LFCRLYVETYYKWAKREEKSQYHIKPISKTREEKKGAQLNLHIRASPHHRQEPTGQSRAEGEAPRARLRPRHTRAPGSATWPHSPLGGTFNEVEGGAGVYSRNIP
jgi:hypothetical protein